MDNSVVVGVGNIYASEVLFASKISPERKANKVTSKECETLVSNIRKFYLNQLKKAVLQYVTFQAQMGN